jgi:hypothetical protein
VVGINHLSFEMANESRVDRGEAIEQALTLVFRDNPGIRGHCGNVETRACLQQMSDPLEGQIEAFSRSPRLPSMSAVNSDIGE